MEIIKWLVTSSADPAKYSLMFRGLLMLAAPYIMQVGPIVCGLWAVLCFDLSLVQPIVDALVNLFQAVLIIVGTVITVWGLCRKLYLGRISAYQVLPADLPL